MDAAKRFWSKLDHKTSFVSTTLIGILWPAYIASGNPMGVAPSAFSTGLWVLTSMTIVRLVIAITIIVMIHNDVKKLVK